jgi:hypothetical protein
LKDQNFLAQIELFFEKELKTFKLSNQTIAETCDKVLKE